MGGPEPNNSTPLQFSMVLQLDPRFWQIGDGDGDGDHDDPPVPGKSPGMARGWPGDGPGLIPPIQIAPPGGWDPRPVPGQIGDGDGDRRPRGVPAPSAPESVRPLLTVSSALKLGPRLSALAAVAGSESAGHMSAARMPSGGPVL